MEQSNVINILYEIVEAAIEKEIDEDKAKSIYLFVVAVKEGLVTSQFVDANALNIFWEQEIRSSSTLTKFVLNTSAELKFRSGASIEQWTELTNNLAHSVVPAANGLLCALDTTLKDRLVTHGQVAAVYGANSWAVTIILLSFMPLLLTKRFKQSKV